MTPTCSTSKGSNTFTDESRYATTQCSQGPERPSNCGMNTNSNKSYSKSTDCSSALSCLRGEVTESSNTILNVSNPGNSKSYPPPPPGPYPNQAGNYKKNWFGLIVRDKKKDKKDAKKVGKGRK